MNLTKWASSINTTNHASSIKFYRQSDLDRYENRKHARAAFMVLLHVFVMVIVKVVMK